MITALKVRQTGQWQPSETVDAAHERDMKHMYYISVV